MAVTTMGVDSSGIDQALAWVAYVHGQIPFAASRALNDVAKQAAADLNNSTGKYFDRPTRFTQRGYYVSRYSSKTDLTVELDLRPIQRSYLLPSIQGGIRPQRPSERRLGIAPAWRPGRDATISNATGNISKAQAIKALKGGAVYFTIKDRRGKLGPGIYERRGRKQKEVRSILRFNNLPNIPRRWPIERIARESVNASWAGLMNRRMAEALATAR
jgi:hypothetical protein